MMVRVCNGAGDYDIMIIAMKTMLMLPMMRLRSSRTPEQ